MATIFYAWQSDKTTDAKNEFIQETLKDVVKEINKELSKSSDDFDELKLDYDTKNTPGSPPITDIILGKIKDCNVFVSDLTIVGKTDSNKSTPNPNVLIEYGYALRSHGYEKIISVMNIFHGEPTELPFDIKHMRFPIQFKLEPGSNDSEKNKIKQSLRSDLKEQIELILAIDAAVSDSLKVEVLDDENADFYISDRLKNMLIVPHLKIKNFKDKDVNVEIKSLEVEIGSQWVPAVRSRHKGEKIKTNKATVLKHPLEEESGNFIAKDENIRVKGHESLNVFVAFDLNIRNFKDLVVDAETLSIRGTANSFDGRKADFLGVIKGYR